MDYEETDEVVVQIGSHEVRTSCLSYGHYQEIMLNEGAEKEKGKMRGGCVDLEGLTPSGHPNCLAASPMHLRGCAIVIGNGIERHILGIGHSSLKFSHDMVDPLFQEGPSCGQVGV